jgi:hypothetical protein
MSYPGVFAATTLGQRSAIAEPGRVPAHERPTFPGGVRGVAKPEIPVLPDDRQGSGMSYPGLLPPAR